MKELTKDELIKLCETIEEAFTGRLAEVSPEILVIARALKQRLGGEAGWKLVPIEPTEEMLESGSQAGDFHIMCYDGIDKPGTPRYSLRKSYKAMIAAVDKP